MFFHTKESAVYLPNVINARIVAVYKIGLYMAFLMTDCESVGNIQYLYMLSVRKLGESQWVFVVTSETSEKTGAPMPFLCTFPGDRHVNLGMSEDWRDLDKFTVRALDIVRDHFQIAQPPILLSDPHKN